MRLQEFTAPYRIHIGCGSWKFDGFVNIDTRDTAAADLFQDCSNLSNFPAGSASLIFSHAFFEHLYLLQRVPLLRDIHRVLRDDGIIYFCGIPDFEVIARCYLEKARGNVSSTFNLMEVYRYTHGLPEHQPNWWLEQLHKSLFDKAELCEMLWSAGFKNPRIFRYAYQDEPNKVNLGFIASKNGARLDENFVVSLFENFSFIYGKNPVEILI